MPNGRYTDIIERLMPGSADPGEIVDLEGRVLGRHDGIIHFTIGQRRGLGVAAGAPLYVVRLDPAMRRVVVGPRDALRTRRIALRDVNWIGEGALDEVLDAGRREVFVKVRSTRAPQPAWLMRGGRRRRGRTDRRRGRRVARSGLRLLRRGGWAGARARRRLHQEHARDDGAANAGFRRARARRVARMRRGGAMAGGLDKATIAKAYARWAPVYDLVFGAVFEQGRKASIAAAERIGGRILEVGVGTGISLPDYSRSNRLVGIDISEPMLRKAHWSRARLKLDNVEALSVMDAAHLAFPDAPSTWWSRNMSSPRCRIPMPRSTNSRACSSPAARSFWSITSARKRHAARLRAEVRADRAPARLAAGIRMGAPAGMDRRDGEHASDRKQADAAARPFLDDPVPQRRPDGTEARRGPLCPGLEMDT